MNVALDLENEAASSFAADVRRGLLARPRQLPAKYFYDDLGSHLFESICQLPWYPITRAESRLLDRHAGEMVAGFGAGTELVELGSGSGEKLRRVARALDGGRGPHRIHLVDISAKALEMSRAALAPVGAPMIGHEATYEDGLRAVTARRRDGARVLVAFLGSNIGNFDPEAGLSLLAEIRGSLRRGDGLLLGADLVRPEAELVLAYDDPLGVTAAFNKNLLVRINAELGGDFDLAAFRHRARWDAAASRIEMHLVSTRRQVVRVPRAHVETTFEEGDSIWTESSYKYTPESIVALAARAGFACERQWLEPVARFSTTLFLASDA